MDRKCFSTRTPPIENIYLACIQRPIHFSCVCWLNRMLNEKASIFMTIKIINRPA